MVSPTEADTIDRPKKKPRITFAPISFSEVDLEGTSQPHDDTLVLTSWIGDFLLKRVDQGSGVEIMYPDLYKGLRLKP